VLIKKRAYHYLSPAISTMWTSSLIVFFQTLAQGWRKVVPGIGVARGGDAPITGAGAARGGDRPVRMNGAVCVV
jgi:hypothetical protein